uniref:mitogen-activated protein kinase kinase n=1 Tax=Acrobeloides nanus TaxID=290746 RepID=A0A914CNW4_9BILA
MDMSLKHFYDKVHQRIGTFPEDLLGLIAINILDGLYYLKAYQNIIHRDIKPQNILLNRTGEIKICDFGQSNLLKNSLVNTTIGTYAYRSPERIKNEGNSYDVRADIWALGLTLVEVAYGKYPLVKTLTKANQNLLEQKIIETKADKIIANCLGSCSDMLKEFVGLCLEKVENRPKYDGLKSTRLYETFSQRNTLGEIQAEIHQIGADIFPHEPIS